MPDSDPDVGLPVGPIDHVAIAVRDMDASLALYERMLGAGLAYRETVAGQDVEVAFLDLPGATSIELISPLSDTAALARFLDRRGEGLHHVCFVVDDVEAALADAEAAGIRLVDSVARPGAHGSRIGFVHPEAFGGVLVELKEKAAESGH